MEGVGKSSERLENNIWKNSYPTRAQLSACFCHGRVHPLVQPADLLRREHLGVIAVLRRKGHMAIMPEPYECFPQYHTRTLLGSPCGSWTACILRFRSFTFSLCFASCLARLSGVNIAPLGIGYGLLSRARASTAGTFHSRPCAQELWGRVGAIQCSFGTLPQCDPVFLITGTLEKSWINPMLIWHTSAV